MALWVFDFETMINICEVSFLSFDEDSCHTFRLDDDTGENEIEELRKFVKGQTLVGYNNKTFDDIILNFWLRHKDCTAQEIQRLAQRIITGQKDEGFNIYKELGIYMNSDDFKTIDLMRLLFSKKLRVGLKELECSLQHDNVEEFECPFDKVLTTDEKEKLIAYNINDCRATKLVLQKSIEALQLRRWMLKEYGIDAFSMDGVNGGVKILEMLYERETGDSSFKKRITRREFVHIKDIILPAVKFKTKEFQDVLKIYQDHIWYSSHYDEELFEDSKLKFEPVINGFKFKFSLGGLHGETRSGIWESDDEYDLMSVDVASYYPLLVLKHGFYPGHLNKKAFLKVYQQVKDERMEAKKNGDKLKDGTLKLSINGAYGMFGNQYSWLFDHKVRLQICVNGQLMLAMLIERLFMAGIVLIDANTDGVYVKVHKAKKELFQKIVADWEKETLMEMEQTKFEKMWFLNSADYFGTYYSKGKLDVKEKGMFLSKVQLGKGMEFPIIAKSIKEYFLRGTDYRAYIHQSNDILDFVTYKKLNKESECWYNGNRIQRTNRYYAAKTGAYIFRKPVDKPLEEIVDVMHDWGYTPNLPSKVKKSNLQHLLKESPVTIYNKFDNKSMSDRNINYGFYTSAAREIVYAIEGDRLQGQLF